MTSYIRIVSFRVTARLTAGFFVASVVSSSVHSNAAERVVSSGDAALAANVWQSGTIRLGSSTQPRFYTKCELAGIVSFIPATLIGPNAGPISNLSTACVLMINRSHKLSKGSDSIASSTSRSATLLHALPWTIGAPQPGERRDTVSNSMHSRAALVRFDRTRGTSQTEVASPPSDGATRNASEPHLAHAPGIVDQPVSPASVTLDPETATRLFGFVLLSVLFAIVLGAAGWFLSRWLRYDSSLLRAARVGLRRGEFRLEYQPVIAISEARCIGLEVLLRWNHAKYGGLGPAHYMPFIEKSRLIRPLTRFVFKQASDELREIGVSKSLYFSLTASVEYIASRSFTEDLDRADEGGMPSLIVKMDSTLIKAFSSRLILVMKQVREKGVRFALSGVRTEIELPVGMSFEMLKIDRDVLALDDCERSTRITALTKMGHELGAVVVVEGVENATHHDIARASHAELGQGFFYSRALNVTRLKEFLHRDNPKTSGSSATSTMLGWRVLNH
ncbi:EAL domain-containing protein [Paraburkholderia sp. IMGN_8]|uniref:EAL domain-containing protein n=1 Tax=Paraburkholderia sp. IMGN_8 TaxID=3136564 RepID=UPI003100C5E3